MDTQHENGYRKEVAKLIFGRDAIGEFKLDYEEEEFTGLSGLTIDKEGELGNDLPVQM